MEEKKIVVLGDRGVGKSSLFKLWLDGVAPEERRLSHTRIVIPRRTEHYELIDTPALGSIDKTELDNLVKNARLLIMVCDIQQPDTALSFGKNFAWIKKSGLPVIFVLNKSDLEAGNWEARKKSLINCGIEKCAIVETTTSDYESLSGLKKKFEEFLPGIPFESERERQIKKRNIGERKASAERVKAREKSARERQGFEVVSQYEPDEYEPAFEPSLPSVQPSMSEQEASKLLSQERQKPGSVDAKKLETAKQIFREIGERAKANTEKMRVREKQEELEEFEEAVVMEADKIIKTKTSLPSEMSVAQTIRQEYGDMKTYRANKAESAEGEGLQARLKKAAEFVVELHREQPRIFSGAKELVKRATQIVGVEKTAAPKQDAATVDDFEVNDQGATTPLLTQFFQYANTYKLGWTHSRHQRAEEINEKLAPDHQNNYRQEQLIMLFAHYMSIRDVNSKLSRELENKLAEALEFEIPNEGRATIRGKKQDCIAKRLKTYLEIKFPDRDPQLPNPIRRIDLLIQILDCVDDLETGFFSYKSKTGKAQIKDTMELANRVYEHLAKKNFFTDAEVSDLIRGLTLPSDAIKIMRNAIPDPRINPLMEK